MLQLWGRFKEVVSAMSADDINLLLSRNGFQFRPEPTPEVEAPPQPVAVKCVPVGSPPPSLLPSCVRAARRALLLVVLLLLLLLLLLRS